MIDYIIILARSGSGKTTVENFLKKKFISHGKKIWNIQLATNRKKE